MLMYVFQLLFSHCGSIRVYDLQTTSTFTRDFIRVGKTSKLTIYKQLARTRVVLDVKITKNYRISLRVILFAP